MRPFTHLQSRTVVLSSSNIDTDQIIPARFLTTTTKEGLGKQLFADWRYANDGTPNPDFALNRPEARGCEILVAGRNFGCGSSREHAPWALVISASEPSSARNSPIFFAAIRSRTACCRWWWTKIRRAGLLEHPGADVAIDLQATRLNGCRPVTALHFPWKRLPSTALVNGIDELGYLQSKLAEYRTL